MSNKDSDTNSEQYRSGRPGHEVQDVGSSSSPTYYSSVGGHNTGGSGMSLHSPGCTSNEDKSLYDSGRTDSGFLSGANLLSDQFVSEEITSPPSYSSQRSREFETSGEFKSDSKSYMRLDSGVDVGLSEQLSGLNLNDVNPLINDLNSNGKSVSESFSSNIRSSSLSLDGNSAKRSSQQGAQDKAGGPLSCLPWEIYFEQDEDGDTQLHIAILHNFIEVVYSLIRMVPHSHYLDIRNDGCQTPLHLAVLTGQSRIVRRLLCSGAAPDILDKHGNTALHLAVSMGDEECVKALTEPVSVADTLAAELKYTPAMFNRHISHEVVYVNRYNYDGLACVHLATMTGKVQLVQLLLWFGADINIRECKMGLTPLHMAVQMCNSEMVHFLLNSSRTLDLEMQTYGGTTAYQMAARQQSALARFLLDSGADSYPLEEDQDDDEYDVDSSDDEREGGRDVFRDSPFGRGMNMNGAINVSA